MFKEFKRQVFGGRQERQRKQSKEKGGPLTSGDYMRVDPDDIDELNEMEKAYGNMIADSNK